MVSKWIKDKRVISIFLAFLLIALSLFVQFWIEGSPVIRVDEGFSLFVSEKISETGQVPSYLPEYNFGQIQNYYPLYIISFYNLYSLAGEWKVFLYIFNIFLLVILFASFASFFNLTKKFLASIIFIFCPVLVYQVFYVHANYYPAFVALFLSLVSLKYLQDFLDKKQTNALIISLLTYGVLPMIHFFNFALFSIVIFFTIMLHDRKGLFQKFKTGGLYILSVIVLSGYYLFLTVYYKIKLSEATPFVPQVSIGYLNLVFPGIILIMIILGSLMLLKKKKYTLAIPFVLLLIWYMSSYTQFYLFANYRVIFMLMLFLPVVIYTFIKSVNNRYLKVFLFVYVLLFGIISYTQVQNNFTIGELKEISEYAEERNLNNITVLSYYRLNTWIPVLIENSTVPLANTDLYSTNYEVRTKVEKLFTKIELEEKWKICDDLNIDYIILIKERGIQDGSVYKGIGDIFNDPTRTFFEKEETDRLYVYRVVQKNEK